MANYIVGDIQGCYDELALLLSTVNFDKHNDTLWLAGDLVARGPKSLETLRLIYSLGDAAKPVLGNHDLHLLAVAEGIHRVNPKDKTADIFDSPDKDQLLHWLRNQPLLVEHPEFLVCHAGISPEWDLQTARQTAREVEAILQSDNWLWLIKNMYTNQPNTWQDNLTGLDRYRYIINAYTRMRFCFPDGALDMQHKVPPRELNHSELLPWFQLPNRTPIHKTILFGHWAALEGYTSQTVIGLDTGCVWGGTLTMLRWEDKQYFIQPALINA